MIIADDCLNCKMIPMFAPTFQKFGIVFVLLIRKERGIMDKNASRLAPTHVDKWTGQRGMR